MIDSQSNTTTESGPGTSAGAWDLRHPRAIMRGSNGAEIHEFLGMCPLKPDADLVDLANTLSREAPFWGGPGKTFSEATTMLGLIRTARWFVGASTEFGPTPYFVSQFDSSWGTRTDRALARLSRDVPAALGGAPSLVITDDIERRNSHA